MLETTISTEAEGCPAPPDNISTDGEDRGIQVDAPAKIFSQPRLRKDRERWLAQMRAASRRRVLRAQARKAQLVSESGGSCMDCGFVGPQECYHFDHRDPSTKRGEVGYMLGTWSMETIRAEVEKCDLVCANCHAIRTKARGAGRPRKYPAQSTVEVIPGGLEC